jgi:hypothetical protein
MIASPFHSICSNHTYSEVISLSGGVAVLRVGAPSEAEMKSIKEALAALEQHKIGEQVTLTVIRDRKQKSIKATLEAR